MTQSSERTQAEARFRLVFSHLGAVTAYARRRGSPDPDAIAAEAMAIAWRRLADVPVDDPRPWLLGTARNLVYSEWRRGARRVPGGQQAPPIAAGPEGDIDGDLRRALRSLGHDEREAVLLIAWDDLTPAQAARSLGISATAFRVRLHRARRRLKASLANPSTAAFTELEMERA
jgi:RNA polymerase sigma-70 factor, ECF subfamily